MLEGKEHEERVPHNLHDNEAFEDDEEDGSKNICSHSGNVSYSSNDSTVNIPEVDIDAAIRKKMESEGLSKPVIEGQLKKKWR